MTDTSMGDADAGSEDGADAGAPAVADREKVPPLVCETAEWAWRLLVIAAAIGVFFYIFHRFEDVTVPIAIAVLTSALLVSLVDFLHRHRVPRGIAVLIAVVAALTAIGAILAFVVEQFIKGLPALTSAMAETVDQVRDWLVSGPLKVNADQVHNVGNDLISMLRSNEDKLTSGALATASTVTEIATGALLVFFLTIFFLYGGGQIWRFVTLILPVANRERVRSAGIEGFGTLVAYVRATVVVAFVDALGIGVGLALLQVPLALPLGALVFVGAFIPIVGALATGALAVLVTLVTKGWVAALIALAVVIGVMQLESHVLQPFLLGRRVRLHPVAVVLAIATGIVAAGIVGGLLAVPLLAFANTVVRHLNRTRSASPDAGVERADPPDPPDPPIQDVTARDMTEQDVRAQEVRGSDGASS